jgi:tetratricopeptide (TPR) repeat protein
LIRCAILLVLLAAASPALRADVLVLRGGARLAFPSCAEEEERVVCQTGAGTVSFKRSAVLQILRGQDEKGAAPTWRTPQDGAHRDEAPVSSRGALEWTLEGFSLEQTGQWQEAQRAYERAADLETAPVAAHLGLARVLLHQGEADRAMAVLDPVLLKHPDNAVAHFLMGEALDARDRLTEAVRAWERAAALDPGFSRRRDRGRRELSTHQDLQRAFAPHFTVSYDGERDETLGRAILETLEDAFDDFVTRFEHYPEATIQVILYSRKDFGEVTGAGPEVGGLFDGKVRLPIGGVHRVDPRVEALARHELAHAFLHDKGQGRVPRWIHEGLAQRVEGRPVTGLSRRLARSLAQAADPDAWAADFSYPKALSRVHHLEEVYGPGRLLDMVQALGEGEEPAAATRRVFGLTPRELLQEWLDWLREETR